MEDMIHEIKKSFRLLNYSKMINNIDEFKPKNEKSIYHFIDLENLVLGPENNEIGETMGQGFALDIIFDFDTGEEYFVNGNKNSGFVAKQLYKSSPGLSYNYPPKGPIPAFFKCAFCGQKGEDVADSPPIFHTTMCPQPFDSSLNLTKAGVTAYVSKKGDNPSKYDYLPMDRIKSGAPYNEIVRKRGQKRIVVGTEHQAGKFWENVEVYYRNADGHRARISVAKNGSINIISAPISLPKLDILVINKINKTNAILLGNYQKVYPKLSQITIQKDLSYVYLITAQFNIIPEQLTSDLYINLGLLNSKLWFNNTYKETIGEETFFSVGGTRVEVFGYNYNSGEKPSKSGKNTNPYIRFYLIDNDVQIFVMMFKRGAVQLKLSYIDKKVSREIVLNPNILVQTHKFLATLLEDIIESAPIIVEDIKISKKEITNTIDGKKPSVCDDRSGLRPVPYTFDGKCPLEGYYVRPGGKKRPDGLWEPCCFKLKKSGKDSLVAYKQILKEGFPNAKQAEEFEIGNPDTKSAIYYPGTKIVQQRRFPGLINLSREQLLACIQSQGYFVEPTIFGELKGSQESQEYKLFQNEILEKYNNLKLIKKNKYLAQGAVALTSTNINLLTKEPYIITPVNKGAINVLLFVDETGASYFISDTMLVSNTSITPISRLANTILEGYLIPYLEEFMFFPIDCVLLNGTLTVNEPYFRSKGNSRYNQMMFATNLLSNNIDSESTLEIYTKHRFDMNILKGSQTFINDADTESILFIGLNDTYTIGKINRNLIMWSRESVNIPLAFMMTATDINTKWKISIDSKKIPETLIPQKNGVIPIPETFRRHNKLKTGDYILFNINLNKNKNSINAAKPLVPIEIIPKEEVSNDYNFTMRTLESILTPFPAHILVDIHHPSLPNGFKIGSTIYTQPKIPGPLVTITV